MKKLVSQPLSLTISASIPPIISVFTDFTTQSLPILKAQLATDDFFSSSVMVIQLFEALLKKIEALPSPKKPGNFYHEIHESTLYLLAAHFKNICDRLGEMAKPILGDASFLVDDPSFTRIRAGLAASSFVTSFVKHILLPEFNHCLPAFLSTHPQLPKPVRSDLNVPIFISFNRGRKQVGIINSLLPKLKAFFQTI